MKKTVIIISLLFFVSCKNDDETNVMYYKLLNYRDELKFYVNDVENYLSIQSEENSFLKKRFDSLNKIQKSFEQQYEKISTEIDPSCLKLEMNLTKNII